jgi:hypothetical protein
LVERQTRPNIPRRNDKKMKMYAPRLLALHDAQPTFRIMAVKDVGPERVKPAARFFWVGDMIFEGQGEETEALDAKTPIHALNC